MATTTTTAIQSHILPFDFLAGPAGAGPVGGVGPDDGVTGSGGLGITGSDAGGVCVGGCGLVCGSINFSLSFAPIRLWWIGGPYL